MVLAGPVELTMCEGADLRALVNGRDVPARVATRARIVLWRVGGKQKGEVAVLAGVSRPTVDLWLERFAVGGLPGWLTGRMRRRASGSQRGFGAGFWR